MKKLSALSLILLLTACQGATTSRPDFSPAELKAEQQAQAEIAKQQAKRNNDQKVPVNAAMSERFKRVSARVGVAGEDLCKQIGGKKCTFGFELEEDKVLNAYADGNKIVISSAMADFADEDELANVVSHEFAHNIMGHVASQQKNAMAGGLLGTALDILASSQGVDTGGNFGQMGAQQGIMYYSVDLENEADYVGLYIMRRAGYDITKSPNFWRKMSAADPNGIYTQTTHPSNPSRYISLNKTIDEIRAKERAGQPLVPGFRKK